jgi:hypothetical protein
MVGSRCINQEDRLEKANNIACMDVIYDRARTVVVVFEDVELTEEESGILQQYHESLRRQLRNIGPGQTIPIGHSSKLEIVQTGYFAFAERLIDDYFSQPRVEGAYPEVHALSQARAIHELHKAGFSEPHEASQLLHQHLVEALGCLIDLGPGCILPFIRTYDDGAVHSKIKRLMHRISDAQKTG